MKKKIIHFFISENIKPKLVLLYQNNSIFN